MQPLFEQLLGLQHRVFDVDLGEKLRAAVDGCDRGVGKLECRLVGFGTLHQRPVVESDERSRVLDGCVGQASQKISKIDVRRQRRFPRQEQQRLHSRPALLDRPAVGLRFGK